MRKLEAFAVVVVFATGCGPEVDDHEDDPPGTLEYEIPEARFYRLDRRLDIVGVDPMVDRSGCGFLTDRAYEDLIGTLEELDPNAEYRPPNCEHSNNGLLYIEDFAYSPFDCNWYCCHSDLLPMVVTYWAAGSSLYGQNPNINGEIYVALEPDMPCPE